MNYERKFSTSIQLSERQFDLLSDIIAMRKYKTSNSVVIREAFDYYVKSIYPQLIKNDPC